MFRSAGCAQYSFVTVVNEVFLFPEVEIQFFWLSRMFPTFTTFIF